MHSTVAFIGAVLAAGYVASVGYAVVEWGIPLRSAWGMGFVGMFLGAVYLFPVVLIGLWVKDAIQESKSSRSSRSSSEG